MKLYELKREFLCILARNSIILSDRGIKAEKNKVNLHWWRLSSKEQNIGDWLSPVVVNFLKEKNGITGDGQKTKHLFAIGSILDGGYQNSTIWGSGLLKGDKKYFWRHFRKLDIRCVRGPETRRVLIKNGYNCPEVYGDPAVLLPLIYQPDSQKKTCDYLVIRHWLYPMNENGLYPLVDDWKKFIDKLVQAKLIISSSLHGIILAEAYGIPAIFLQEDDLDLFKYRDYYSSTGRTDFPMAKTVQEALSMQTPPLPDMEKLQQNLISSFPDDLWR